MKRCFTLYKIFGLLTIMMLSFNLKAQVCDTVIMLETPITDYAVVYVKAYFADVDGTFNTGIALSQDTVKAWGDYSVFLRTNNVSNTAAGNDNLWDVRSGSAFVAPLEPVPFDLGLEYECWIDIDYLSQFYSAYVKSSEDADPMTVYEVAAFRKIDIEALNYICTPYHTTEGAGRLEILDYAIVSAVGEVPGGGDPGTGVTGNKAAKLRMYPNPATTTISIQTTEPVSEVSVFDISGKNIKFYNKPVNNLLDVTSLKNGIYFAKIVTNGNTFTQKFVIKK